MFLTYFGYLEFVFAIFNFLYTNNSAILTNALAKKCLPLQRFYRKN